MSYFSAFMVGMALFAVGVFIVKYTDWFYAGVISKPGGVASGLFCVLQRTENRGEKKRTAEGAWVCTYKKVGRKGAEGGF